MDRGSNEGNYLVEIEGITSIRAMNVSGGKVNHTPTLINQGNKSNPNVARGNYEVDEVTIKQATALNDTGREFFAWLYETIKGIGVIERRTLRIIELNENGTTPVQTWEYINCLPTSIQPDDRAARGQNAAAFTFTLKPEDVLQTI
jgi:phage tail-like protein